LERGGRGRGKQKACNAKSQVLNITLEEDGTLSWLGGPLPDKGLADEKKTSLDLTRLAEYAPDPAAEVRRISFLVLIAQVVPSFKLVDTQETLPPQFSKQLSDLALKGFERFTDSMLHLLGDAVAKPTFNARCMWALVTKLNEQGRVGTQSVAKHTLDALQACCSEMDDLVKGLNTISIEESAKLPNTKLSSVLLRLKSLQAEASAALTNADCAGDPPESIQRSDKLQLAGKAALTQFGLSKLLKVPLIKNVEKGAQLRLKLSELAGIAQKPDLKDFMSASVMDVAAEVPS
jgi:hypothetical protein